MTQIPGKQTIIKQGKNKKERNKIMKKAFAILMSLVLMLSLAVPAMAADEPTTGTITIKDSEQNTEYRFYRLFDLALQDLDGTNTTYESYTYTLSSKWHDIFTSGALKSYLVNANTGSLNSINVDGTIKYINITDANVVEFTNAAMAVTLAEGAPTVDETKTGSGSDLEFDVNTLGYYLMVPVDAVIKTPNSNGSVASLTSTKPEAAISVKATKPSLEKVDDKVTVDVGDTVTYTLTTTVPNTAGYKTYTFKIYDEMTEGLTFQKDVEIKIADKEGNITNDTGVVIDYTSKANAFTVTIPVANYQDYIGKTITLTYTAVVNDKAVKATAEKNKAKLEYGHNPNDLEQTTPIEEEVYTTKIVIDKYTGTNSKLANAKFALMNTAGKFYKYTAATDTTDAKVEWVELTGGPAANNTADVTDVMATVIKTAAEAFTITTYATDTNGAAEFKGIADGDYYLVEYEAPAGYNRLQKAIKVTVAGTDVDTAAGKVENKADSTGSFDVPNPATASVLNQAGSTLPETGGMGTTIFYIVGGVMVAAAVVLLITKKRMGAEG